MVPLFFKEGVERGKEGSQEGSQEDGEEDRQEGRGEEGLMRATIMGWLGLGLAAVLAFFLNAYAFVIYELVQCDALDGSGIAGDGRLATMCGRDDSLASVGFWVFVAAGIASLAGLVVWWRRSAGVAGKVVGCAIVVVAPVATYLVLALVTP